MKTLRIGRFIALGLIVAVGLGPWASAQDDDLTGDEVLQRAADEGGFNVQGSQISRTTFDLVFSDGSTGSREFAFLSKTERDGIDKSLIYFLRPEAECGTMFLTHDPDASGEDSQLWLFLSALGDVKELVNEEDRNASFAGSNLERDEIGGGGQDFSDDYVGALQGTEMVEVSWRGETVEREAYHVTLEAREGADVDFPTGQVWIDTEEFVTFRAELNNANGTLERTLALDQFVEFAGDVVPNRIVVENVLDGSKTTVTTEDRRRPESELPESVFDAESLGEFNPEEYGIDSPCVNEN